MTDSAENSGSATQTRAQAMDTGWTTLIVDADGNPCVPEHSRVVRGVLCRWWGDEQPEGVSIIDRAADYDALAAQLAAAERERDRAWRALTTYGKHLDSCGDADAFNHAEVQSCGCGFDAAIDAALERT